MKKIKLTKNKVVLVDDERFEYLNQWKWHYLGCGYAARREYPSRRYIYMHRLIIEAKKGQEVDHINQNKLDNRKNNLRFVNRSQNMMNTGLRKTNTSGYRGVSWDKSKKRWAAEITTNYKKKHLGYFKELLEAVNAYKKALASYQGS